MAELEIEKSLKKVSRSLSEPLYGRYEVLAYRLFTQEYEHWAAKMPSGNNHGPAHIKRVLANLDALLGKNPFGVIQPYELFLTMMSVLYHDVGILGARETHAELSAKYILEEGNNYIFDERDRAIISAAVASHSSSKDIEAECQAFSQEEHIGQHMVRPRTVAALVRLADELDEDYRRADPQVAKRLAIKPESQFYWEFCQRIQGIRPYPKSQEIHIDVKFKKEDTGRSILVESDLRSFLAHFARKLAKINRERVTVIRFLPEPIRYKRLVVSVKPIDNHPKWKKPREFIWNDHSTASEFVAAFPELSIEPAAQWLREALEAIRLRQLDSAIQKLHQVKDLRDDLPMDMALRVLFDRSCAESLKAETFPASSQEYTCALDNAVEYLKLWVALGSQRAWAETGRTPQSAIHGMGCDSDLLCVLSKRREAIKDMLGIELMAFLPEGLPIRLTGGGGGCVPIGVLVLTPQGPVPVEELKIGSEIVSCDTQTGRGNIVTRVAKVHTSRGSKCIELNRRCLFSPSQPLYLVQDQWIPAQQVTKGAVVLGEEQQEVRVTEIREVQGYFELYTLTTDHPSHNFVAHGLVCGNKELADWRY